MNLDIFNTANLFEAATHLFQQLKIQLNSNTAEPLPTRDILKHHYKDNATFNAIEKTYFLGIIDDSVFRATGLFDTNYSYKQAIEQGDENYNGLMLFALELNNHPTRTEISELTRAFNRISLKMPVALLLKYPPTSLLEGKPLPKGESFISIAISERFKYLQNWRQGEKAGKVIMLRDIHTQNTHAGHIRILKDLITPNNVRNYEQLHQHWLQVLDVSILNKKFFQELSNWYFAAMKEVSFPDDMEKNEEVRNATNLIRLITRVIFIWFIKEKQLVPASLFQKDFVASILKDFNKDKHAHNYYNAILQNLFFATLNQKRGERKFAKEGNFNTNREEYGVKNLFRYADLFTISEEEVLKLFKDVPFLNGGLFDCLDKPNDEGKIEYVDGFSRNPKKQAIVPDYLFFGEEKEVDLNNIYGTKNKRYSSRGLINLLESYKFTVAENTPIEEEVALDPELLGKVFENLLASYNPETQTTARKQTGSFYTPREIVSYMVDESLLEYLKQNLKSSSPESGEVSAGRRGWRGQGINNLPHLKTFRKELRKNPTPAEAKLWTMLKGRQLEGRKFRRQHSVANYILDFYCPEEKLAIELDGQYHFEATQAEYDYERDLFLQHCGIKVLRFENKWVWDNPEGLLNEIKNNFGWYQKPLSQPLADSSPLQGKQLLGGQPETDNTPLQGKQLLGGQPETDNTPLQGKQLLRGQVTGTENMPLKGEQLLRGQVTGTDNTPLQGKQLLRGQATGTENMPLQGEQLLEARLRKLLSYDDAPHDFNQTETRQIIEALNNCKILDPACGSGAFPMGILHKMVHILQKLDPENKYWKEVQRESIIGAEIRKLEQDKKAIEGLSDAQVREKALQAVQERLKELEEIFNKSYNFDDYSRKLYLIENCIYGIDIQPIAVQIAKLRFFISLIIDQNVRPSSMMDQNNKNNLGIRPLPNLETKFVAANTLIGLDKPQQLTLRNPKIEEKEKQLKELRHQYFTASTRKEKLKLQKQDKQLRKEIADLLKADGWSSKVAEQIVSFDPYDQNQSCGWFDPEWMFGIIVPPTSLSEKKVPPTSLSEKKVPPTSLPEKKVPPTSLPELNSGFDIIIGNPPYIQLQKEGGKLAKAYEKQGYKTFERTGDIYSLFYEKGMQLLKPKGILTYITSNKWMRAGYGKSTRQFFLQYNPKKLIDLGSGIFESATVDTNILLIQKAPNQNQLQAVDLSKSKNIEQLNHLHYHTLKNLSAESWTISSDIEQRIKAKIEAKGKPLKEWDIQINYGIKTGYNEAFIIDGKKRAELIAQDPRSAEIIKPLLRGRDIKRYHAEWQDLWLIATFPALKLNIDDYPAVRDYLKSFGKKLHQTGEEFIDENGQKQKTRKKTGNKWFETQDQIAYYQEFEKEKIVFQEMVQFSSFLYDEFDKYFCLDTGRIITGTKLKFLVAILNSKLFFYAVKNFYGGGGLGETGVRMKHTFFQEFYIPEETPEITDLVTQILALKSEGKDTSELEKQIDQLVYQLYDLTEEEIAFIENSFK